MCIRDSSLSLSLSQRQRRESGRDRDRDSAPKRPSQQRAGQAERRGKSRTGDTRRQDREDPTHTTLRRARSLIAAPSVRHHGT
eukprot:1707297-Pyramimonas_sp.AAC.1